MVLDVLGGEWRLREGYGREDAQGVIQRPKPCVGRKSTKPNEGYFSQFEQSA